MPASKLVAAWYYGQQDIASQNAVSGLVYYAESWPDQVGKLSKVSCVSLHGCTRRGVEASAIHKMAIVYQPGW